MSSDSKNINKTKLTAKAKLDLNVNKFRNRINEVFVPLALAQAKLDRNLKKTRKDDDGDKVEIDIDYDDEETLMKYVKPKCNNAHVYIAAFNERLCKILIENAKQHVSEDKSGLLTIGRDTLRNVIELNDKLKRCLISYLSMYDETLGYSDNFPIPKKLMIEHIECRHGSSIHFTPQAYDFLAYILSKITNNLIIKCWEILNFAGKKSINYKTVVTAVRLELCNSESLRDEFIMHLKEKEILVGAIKGDGDSDTNNSDVESDSDSNDDSSHKKRKKEDKKEKKHEKKDKEIKKKK